MAEPTVFAQALAILEKAAAAPHESEELAVFPLDWVSDLDTEQARALSHTWRRLPDAMRRDLMSRMDEESRVRFELDFIAVARIALADEDSEVRAFAIRTLWECEDAKLADRFLQMMEHDPDRNVRAAAAGALGPFVERAEFETVPPEVGARLLRHLLAVIHSDAAVDIRARAVESVGYSSAPEVAPVITEAYAHRDGRMRIAAVVAAGRTADAAWGDMVLEALGSTSPALRAEAARAAGGISLRQAVPVLAGLLDESELQVRRAAIEALGEIGGGRARRALERRLKDAGEEESVWIDEAIENAEFEVSLKDLDLLDVHPGEEEEEVEEEEEEDEDEDDEGEDDDFDEDEDEDEEEESDDEGE